MRLKSFYAKSMKEAMQMVRETLGEDAIIVATREENGGKTVRVTAAVEQDDSYEDDFAIPNFELDPEGASADHDRDEWLQYDDEDEAGAVIEELTDIMLRHSVPEDLTDQVLSCATVLGVEQTDVALVAALEHLFAFRPLNQKKGAPALMMVGPPGAGKTLATAKLATRAVMAGGKVAVITTDSQRAGGAEQLSAFTKILRINLVKADGPKQLREAIEAARGADQILIDTAGINPFSADETRDLARLVAAGSIDPVLVMPAGIDAEESGEIGRAYAAVGVKSMLPTRLDITRRLGGILSAAHHGGLIFAEGSHTPKVADGLFMMTPKRLAALLMPQARQTQDKSAVKPPRKKQTVNAGS
jgi:flagellar biosynthesis protein FlhF